MKQRYKTYRASVEANSKERSLNNLPADYPSRPWSSEQVEAKERYFWGHTGKHEVTHHGRLLSIEGYDDILSPLAELRWLGAGCPAIFIETTELLNMLMSCKLEINLEELFIPIFETTSPPSHNSYTSLPEAAKIQRAVTSFAVPAGSQIDPFCVSREVHSSGEWVYVITGRTGFFSHFEGHVGTSEWLAHAISGDPVWWSHPSLTDRHREQLAGMWRLFLATLLYIKAFPHLIENGPPVDTTPLERRSILKGSGRITTISLPPAAHNAPAPHLRRFHFRTLRAERYRRNADGSPRVIAVRQAVIGDISRTKTAKEPKGLNG